MKVTGNGASGTTVRVRLASDSGGTASACANCSWGVGEGPVRSSTQTTFPPVAGRYQDHCALNASTRNSPRPLSAVGI